VHRYFAGKPLRRRIVALVAAYAIALSSLLATFTAARAAAATVPGGVICHTLDAGQQAPASDQSNGNTCADNCCVGCLMLTALLPPPPANVIGAPQSAATVLEPPAIATLSGKPQSRSYQSRAPPLTA
jgi:hypothetical protein